MDLCFITGIKILFRINKMELKFNRLNISIIFLYFINFIISTVASKYFTHLTIPNFSSVFIIKIYLFIFFLKSALLLKHVLK